METKDLAPCDDSVPKIHDLGIELSHGQVTFLFMLIAMLTVLVYIQFRATLPNFYIFNLITLFYLFGGFLFLFCFVLFLGYF